MQRLEGHHQGCGERLLCSDPLLGLNQANWIGDVDTYMGYVVDPKGRIDATDGDSESKFTTASERAN
jgi:hypothetical protein